MTAPLWTHHPRTWWRHQMKTFSALLDLCAGNSPVTGEFPAQRPMTRSFDDFYDLRPNRRFSKQPWVWWFETPSRPLWRHCDGFTTSRNLIWRARQVEWTPHSGINWLVGLWLNILWKFSQVCIGLIQAYLKPFTLRIHSEASCCFPLYIVQIFIVRRAGLLWSQQDFEWWWSVPLSSATLY